MCTSVPLQTMTSTKMLSQLLLFPLDPFSIFSIFQSHPVTSVYHLISIHREQREVPFLAGLSSGLLLSLYLPFIPFLQLQEKIVISLSKAAFFPSVYNLQELSICISFPSLIPSYFQMHSMKNNMVKSIFPTMN